MGVVAVVPAKMTSARLPRKNVKSLCGQPLLYYSVRVAQLVDSIKEVYVSSENKEVLSLADSIGAMAVRRPESLSRPEITNIDVLRHMYEVFLEKPEVVILLQPTHPLRRPKDIQSAITLFKESDADSLFTVVKADELRGTIEGGFFCSEAPLPRRKSQEPKKFRNTGSFYLFRPERTFLTEVPFGNRILPYVLSRAEFEIDINQAHDLRIAECVLRTFTEEFSHFEML